MNLKAELEKRLSAALAACGAPDGSPAMVAQAAQAGFGDYQANGVMPAAKALKTNPRQLAEKVVAAAKLADLAERVEVAGAGFINITLKENWLADRLSSMLTADDLGADKPANPQTVVVDYSGPNLAKEMHVGHLRSTIIGDALARVLKFLGHAVIRQNHVGDWGTQFGMLSVYYVRSLAAEPRLQPLGGADVALTDLEEFYRKAKAEYDANPEFAERSREFVVKLQRGDFGARKYWEWFRNASLKHCEGVYQKLGVRLTSKDVRGESFYNEDLPYVVEDLAKAGLLRESQGAQCVFLPQFAGKDGEPLPLIVQKSDEGYLYATTDLAAIRYRVGTLHAHRILYVTDSRQSLHFQQVFAVARAAGFAPESVSLEHVAFGTMMGAGGRPFKTREGDTVKLMALLDEAEQRALTLVSEKNPELPEEQRRNIARAVGIGAVKYADLSQNRTSDYVFSWDKMLSLDGNTAPYMQYAYARIRSIFRKGGLAGQESAGEIVLADPAERALAMKLAQFPEALAVVAADCMPNVLCAYLYDLAGRFMGFYENCPVLQSEEPLRSSRLRLCELTARTIRTGLDLLGIETIEQM
jgi:arginyl-tRNA synthetase